MMPFTIVLLNWIYRTGMKAIEIIGFGGLLFFTAYGVLHALNKIFQEDNHENQD